MKKQTLYCIAVSVLFLLFGSLTASAQSLEPLMTVQVPFDFQAGGKVLPAGQYIIKRDSQTPSILLIQAPQQKIFVTVHTIQRGPSKQQTQASLVFNAYDEKHFLSEVRFSGDGIGYSLFESKAERQLAQAAQAHGQVISSK